MPGLICLREKLWTRTYSIGDQVPTCPVFTRAKIKSRFGILVNLPSQYLNIQIFVHIYIYIYIYTNSSAWPGCNTSGVHSFLIPLEKASINSFYEVRINNMELKMIWSRVIFCCLYHISQYNLCHLTARDDYYHVNPIASAMRRNCSSSK